MKVVVDEGIPYVKDAIGTITGDVAYAPGDSFTPELIKDADALIVRTRTLCNRELLEGSNVQFIATATAGYDHIDTRYCREAGISWISTPGANANAVAEYVEAALLLLQKDRGIPLNRMKIGIVGVGNVGAKVSEKANAHGLSILENDPPRAAREGNGHFVTLEQIARECDIISFHTPLIMEGEYKTYHLADKEFFHLLKKKPFIINTARGEVIDTAAMLVTMKRKRISDVIIDVWENEPDISRALLKRAYVATPHIAGYSADAKGNAVRMALEGLCKHFNITDAEINIELPRLRITTKKLYNNYGDIALITYDPRRDTKKLKKEPERFEEFRNNHPLKREAEVYHEAYRKCFNYSSFRKHISRNMG